MILLILQHSVYVSISMDGQWDLWTVFSLQIYGHEFLKNFFYLLIHLKRQRYKEILQRSTIAEGMTLTHYPDLPQDRNNPCTQAIFNGFTKYISKEMDQKQSSLDPNCTYIWCQNCSLWLNASCCSASSGSEFLSRLCTKIVVMLWTRFFLYYLRASFTLPADGSYRFDHLFRSIYLANCIYSYDQNFLLGTWRILEDGITVYKYM